MGRKTKQLHFLQNSGKQAARNFIKSKTPFTSQNIEGFLNKHVKPLGLSSSGERAVTAPFARELINHQLRQNIKTTPRRIIASARANTTLDMGGRRVPLRSLIRAERIPAISPEMLIRREKDFAGAKYLHEDMLGGMNRAGKILGTAAKESPMNLVVTNPRQRVLARNIFKLLRGIKK